MKRKLLALTLICSIFCLTISTNISAKAETRIPESTSYNGILPDGTSANVKPNISPISPYFLIRVEYVSGAYLHNKSVIYKHKYIYGTSVSYVKGASPSYTLTVTKSATSSHQLSASTSAKFDIKAVTAEVKGGYQYTNTSTITKGQSWGCNFTTPGLYNLSWYQRAHQYNIFGKCKYITTDTDNGQIKEAYLGTITFPTDEVHFEVTK